MKKKKVSLKIDPSGKPWKQGLDDVLFDPICQGYQLQQKPLKKTHRLESGHVSREKTKNSYFPL